jgi:hypothetical protein
LSSIYFIIQIIINSHIYIYIYIYIYIIAYLSINTVTVSLYKTINQTIRQHTALYYVPQQVTKVSVDPPSPINCHLFLYFKIRCPFRSQVQFVCYGWFPHEFSWVSWRGLRNKKIWYILELGKVNFIYWQNDRKNPINAYGELT